MPDHSTNATAMRPFWPARMASITRGLENAAAYPERCRSNFDSSMLLETSAARMRSRSTRSAPQVKVQPVVAISAATTKVRTPCIMLEPCFYCCGKVGTVVLQTLEPDQSLTRLRLRPTRHVDRL